MDFLGNHLRTRKQLQGKQVSILALIVRINLEGAPSPFAILAVRRSEHIR